MSQPGGARQAARYPPGPGASVSCRLGALGLGPELGVLLLEVSGAGARLLAAAALRKGDVITVGLLAPGWDRPLRRLAEVIWSEPAGEGGCRAGVLFHRRLGAALRDLCSAVPVHP